MASHTPRGLGSLLLLTFLAFATVFHRLSADLFVVLLEGCKILAGLGELTFFHTLTDIPMDERAFGIHQVKLVVQAGEHLSDGGGVGNHAHSALHLGKVTAGDDSGGLVVDTALEASRALVGKLNGTLGLDGGDGGVHVFGDDVTTVHHAAGHVLTVTGVALDHGGCRLEGRVGDFGNRQLLVVSLLGGDDRSIGRQQKVDTRVGCQVGLNSVISTFRAPSKRRDAVSEEMIWATRWFKLV